MHVEKNTDAARPPSTIFGPKACAGVQGFGGFKPWYGMVVHLPPGRTPEQQSSKVVATYKLFRYTVEVLLGKYTQLLCLAEPDTPLQACQLPLLAQQGARPVPPGH